ncbi:MAG TPA: glutathione S-transferase family protein [Aestuariivirga sp.]
MKLYGSLNSPFVRMSMVTAMECGLGLKVQLVNTSVNPTEANAALEKLSPIAKIPVLETDHGQVVYDSRVIMEFFCHTSGNKNLLPDEPIKHFRVLTLLAMAQGLGDTAVGLRYETFTRPKEALWPEFVARQRLRIGAVMSELEAKWMPHLSDLSLGSIGIAAALGYIELRQLAPDWRAKFPDLSHWYEQFSKRESMAHSAPVL